MQSDYWPHRTRTGPEMTDYRAMHFSAKRGIAIACRLSARLSVCNVGELWSHRLEIFENTIRYDTIAEINVDSKAEYTA